MRKEAPAPKLESAREVRGAARFANYDDGASRLRELVLHPGCARGTAQRVHWLCEPGKLFGACFPREAVAGDDGPGYAEIFDLIVELETRLEFLPDGSIGRTPGNAEGVDLLEDTSDLARPIPEPFRRFPSGPRPDPKLLGF